MKITLLSFVLLALLCLSCDRENPRRPGKPEEELREPLIKANKEVVRAENEQIVDFLRRYKWQMTETGTGLRYMVYRPGTGLPADRGDEVTLSYSVTSLTGDTLYTSREKGLMAFIVGKAQVISGLEEGILLLHQGDRAKFIIPSHLAFGLIGDQEHIGPRATLVYDVELLKINKIKK